MVKSRENVKKAIFCLNTKFPKRKYLRKIKNCCRGMSNKEYKKQGNKSKNKQTKNKEKIDVLNNTYHEQISEEWIVK